MLAGCPFQESKRGGEEDGELKLLHMPCHGELPGFSIRWKFNYCILCLAPCLTSKEHQRRRKKDKDLGGIDH